MMRQFLKHDANHNNPPRGVQVEIHDLVDRHPRVARVAAEPKFRIDIRIEG